MLTWSTPGVVSTLAYEHTHGSGDETIGEMTVPGGKMRHFHLQQTEECLLASAAGDGKQHYVHNENCQSSGPFISPGPFLAAPFFSSSAQVAVNLRKQAVAKRYDVQLGSDGVRNYARILGSCSCRRCVQLLPRQHALFGFSSIAICLKTSSTSERCRPHGVCWFCIPDNGLARTPLAQGVVYLLVGLLGFVFNLGSIPRATRWRTTCCVPRPCISTGGYFKVALFGGSSSPTLATPLLSHDEARNGGLMEDVILWLRTTFWSRWHWYASELACGDPCDCVSELPLH